MNFIDKVLDVFGMGDDHEEAVESENEVEREISIETPQSFKKGKVVNMHSPSNAKVMLIQPSQFEEIKTVCDCLKERRIAIVNLKKLDVAHAQRCVDFASGAVSSVDGSIQQVSPGVFLIAPSCVEVTSDLKDELSSRGIFSWTNK